METSRISASTCAIYCRVSAEKEKAMPKSKSIWKTVDQEIHQEFGLRKPLLSRISKHFENRYVVSLYTRFASNVTIDNSDPEMLRTLLMGSQKPLSNKILFLIHSPGGDPLAAERIIKILREHSDDDYWVLVPGTAKSAATMICFGANKMLLNSMSELGPIDLQVVRGDRLIPAYSIITAYDNLVKEGINLKAQQRIEPILQQLQGFDPAEIETFRRVNELSSDIAIKVLRRGMLKRLNATQVKDLIKIFLDPTKSKTHGRPIYYSDIREIDKDNNFNIELIETTDKMWSVITEYHTRATNHLRVTNGLKLLESEETSFRAGG